MIRPLCPTLVSMARTGLIGSGRWVSSTQDLHLSIHDGMLFYNCSEKWVNSTLKYTTFRQFRWRGIIIEKLSQLQHKMKNADVHVHVLLVLYGIWGFISETINNLGPHTLRLQAVLNESGSTIYAGKSLPSHQIKFTVTGQSI